MDLNLLKNNIYKFNKEAIKKTKGVLSKIDYEIYKFEYKGYGGYKRYLFPISLLLNICFSIYIYRNRNNI